MIYKAIAVVTLLMVGNFAVGYIRDGYEKGRVVPPERDLSTLPLQLTAWQGTDLPSDPRLREILRAKAGIDRLYRNESGQEVLVHAVWTDDYLRIHFPQQCYRESGWDLTDTEDVQVERDGGQSFPAKILSFTQDGQKIQVLYWFRLGEHVFLDRLGHRLLRRQVCWGETEWPPLMKFMLETEDTGLGRSEDLLLEVASILEDSLDEQQGKPESEPLG